MRSQKRTIQPKPLPARIEYAILLDTLEKISLTSALSSALSILPSDSATFINLRNFKSFLDRLDTHSTPVEVVE